MESFNIPEQSIGELMENVRAEVKITEIRAQTDRLQTEIAARESDIADKELTISGQTKQLNSLMALDSTVAPLKAKDAIVSVIDAKIDKLTLINDSLKEKLNNFRRALEDNGFQEMRLEQSSESISTVLVRKQFAKEEEFKRQVLLAGREEPDNISVMSALPAQLDDPEIERLKSDLANRTMDRQEAMRASAMLKGAMGEISRHIAVNNAEIESLRQEKSNINRKYLELVAQNQAESTQQYLKSLETNGATRYLLGIQEDVVKNETELRALKRDLEQKKGRLTELTTRLNYLSDNRRSVSDEGGLEVIMQTNEQIKHELADIGDRLSLSYKQHKTILDTIDQLDNKRLRIQELIIETLQKIRANEREIVAAGEKAEEFAGGETEERLAELEGELEEVESERNMLFDSKENLSRQVFDKRVELRCLEIDCDVKEKALEECLGIANMANIFFVRQKQTLGLGHAVSMAKPFTGDDPFVVIYGDDVIWGEDPVCAQLIRAYEEFGRPVAGVSAVPWADVSRYCSLKTTPIHDNYFFVDDMIEKPKKGQEFSNYSILGRVLLTPEIYDLLAHTKPGAGGEIQLTDAMAEYARNHGGMTAVEFTGKHYDMGNKLKVVEAQVELALQHPEIGEAFRAYLKEFCKTL